MARVGVPGKLSVWVSSRLIVTEPVVVLVGPLGDRVMELSCELDRVEVKELESDNESVLVSDKEGERVWESSSLRDPVCVVVGLSLGERLDEIERDKDCSSDKDSVVVRLLVQDKDAEIDLDALRISEGDSVAVKDSDTVLVSETESDIDPVCDSETVSDRDSLRVKVGESETELVNEIETLSEPLRVPVWVVSDERDSEPVEVGESEYDCERDIDVLSELVRV